MARENLDGDLLFGLLALQTGLIGQTELLAAFHAWAREKCRPIADHLVDLGYLDSAQRSAVEALVVLHVAKHDGRVEKSLAAMATGRSAREAIRSLGDSDVESTLQGVGLLDDTPRDEGTLSYAVGESTSEGQRFRVLRPHAQGGLGAVFVALDEELHREVALKQILDRHADDPVCRRRFLLEAEITGSLEHPGIVPVYGLGTHSDGRPFYAMRFVEGESLKEAIGRFHDKAAAKADEGERSLGLRKLLRRFVDICNAIHYAHSRGVLHRDIKPGNVIVGRHGETLVVDWGLAKTLGRSDPASGERTLVPSGAGSSSETQPGSALGTPAYMSPEAAAGEIDKMGPWSDVYSLGATLYCLVTGVPPFEEDDLGAILKRVREGEFPRPSQLRPFLDAALEAICLKAMALRPADRYPTPRALADDIERWMADEPVSAWREPFLRRARRSMRRHRTLVTSVAATLLAGIVGLAAVLVVQTKANADLFDSLHRETAAKQELANANRALVVARDAAQARFDLAIAAIRTFHTGVSEDLLLKEEQFRELRGRLLGGAVDFYRKLEVLLGGGSDPASRRALGNAYAEVGELTEKIGKVPEALGMHRKALDVRRALASEPSADSETRADLARSLVDVTILLEKMDRTDEAMAAVEEARTVLSRLLAEDSRADAIQGELARLEYWSAVAYFRTGKTQEARTNYERARALVEPLAAAHPEVVNYQRLLSWCFNDAGMLLTQKGDLAGALESLLRSRELKKQISDAHAEVEEFRRDLAAADFNVGTVCAMMGRLPRAIEEFEHARSTQEQLVRAYPAVIGFASDLGKADGNLGWTLMMMKRPGEAREALERALVSIHRVAEARPNVPEHQADLANCLENLGRVRMETGDIAGAIAKLEEARAIYEPLARDHPDVTLYSGWLADDLAGLGKALVRAGRAADGAKSLRRSIALRNALPSVENDDQFDQGRSHALLATLAGTRESGVSAESARLEADEAMKWLRQAVEGGYKGMEDLKTDPDFRALRDRDDFRVLIQDMAMPDDPFAPAR